MKSPKLTDSTMPSDLLVPYKGDHAIQNVTFALEWGGLLDPSAFLEIRKIHSIADKLPKVSEQKALTVSLSDGPGGASASPSFDVEGVAFERFSPHGLLSKSLVINRQHCAVTNNEYTRWIKVWPEARELFGMILPTILQYQPVAAIGLQYTDIFTWRGNNEDFDLSILFNQESELLPNHIFELKSLWHLHQGYFDEPEIKIDLNYKTLNNININLVDMDGVLAIHIVTAQRVMFIDKEINYEGWASKDGVLDMIISKLHDVNKVILSKLLTTEIQNKIKLT